MTPKETMDKKADLLHWQTERQIPGKIQASFTAPASNVADWCIRVDQRDPHHHLHILNAGGADLDPPALVEDLLEYLSQEHQYYTRKAMLQLYVRPTAPGEWAVLLQAQIRGAGTGHALKLMETFLQRKHPEVKAFHRVDCKPFVPFSLQHPPKSMKYDLHPIFGPEILPLASSGQSFHILEWLPAIRDPWLKLPEKLLASIHPMPGDCLLDLHCGSGFLGIGMAKAFQEVHCVDARGISQLSVTANLKDGTHRNVHYTQATVDGPFIEKFLSSRKGPFTVILNPQHGEALPTGVIQALANPKVGRVVHIGSDPDMVEAEIRRWRRAGMLLRKMVPLDLNPTAKGIELALFLAPDREGVLRKGAEAKKLALAKEAMDPKAKAPAKALAKTVKPDQIRFVQKGKPAHGAPKDKATHGKPARGAPRGKAPHGKPARGPSKGRR